MANIVQDSATLTMTRENQFEQIRDLISRLWNLHASSRAFDQKAAVLRKEDTEIDAIIKSQESKISEQFSSFLQNTRGRLRKNRC